MVQDEFEILLLAGAIKIFSAFPAADYIGTRVVPAGYPITGLLRFDYAPTRAISPQSKAHLLVLTAKLPRDPPRTAIRSCLRVVPSHCQKIPEAGQINRLAAHGIEQQLGPNDDTSTSRTSSLHDNLDRTVVISKP
jgi:hypothetical protein